MHSCVPVILRTVFNCGFQDLSVPRKGVWISRETSVVIRRRYLPCVEKMLFYSLPCKIILNFLADKLASGLGHTICNIFDTLMNSKVILLIKKIEIPVFCNFGPKPTHQQVELWFPNTC